MNRVARFIKSSAIYFAGNVLTKIISFFLLPLYTGYIAQADMGYYDLSTSYINIIVPVVCMDIWSGIMRYMFDFEEREDKYKAIFNGCLIFCCSVLLYAVGTGVLGIITDIRYLLLIFLFGLFTMIQTVYTYVARGLGYNAIFAASGIVGSLVNSGSNIVMILVLNMRIESLYIALILGLLVQIIIMETKVKLIKHFSFKLFDWAMVKSMLRFSLPLSLNSACFWFLSSYNRVGISNTLGLEANGIYSIAAKFTYVLGLVSNCFSMAWQEMVYSMGNEKEDKDKLYSLASNYYLRFLMFGLVLLVPVVYVAFPILINPQYQDAFNLVPMYLFATVASIYSVFLGDIFGAEKKTGSIFTSTVAAAVVNVSLFHILVGFMGIQAANISLLCGFLVNIIFRIVLLRKSIKITLNYKMLLGTTALFVVAFVVYLTQGMVANIAVFVVFLGIALFSFRDLLQKGLEVVKQKKAELKEKKQK